jgi:hypothetical protein
MAWQSGHCGWRQEALVPVGHRRRSRLCRCLDQSCRSVRASRGHPRPPGACEGPALTSAAGLGADRGARHPCRPRSTCTGWTRTSPDRRRRARWGDRRSRSLVGRGCRKTTTSPFPTDYRPISEVLRSPYELAGARARFENRSSTLQRMRPTSCQHPEFGASRQQALGSPLS